MNITISVASRDFLPLAIASQESIQENSKDVKSIIFCTDYINSSFLNALSHKYQDIEFRNFTSHKNFILEDHKKYHTDLEFNVSLKPLAIIETLQKYPISKILYVDSDILFLKELNYLFNEYNDDQILLWPHRHLPSYRSNAFMMTRNGIFNAGLFGVSGECGKNFVKWWWNLTKDYCFMEPEEGLFVDQKWLDMAPCFFKNIKINRDGIDNIGHWNIDLSELNEVNSLHLSGFDLMQDISSSSKFSKYCDVYISEVWVKPLIDFQSKFINASKHINKIDKPNLYLKSNKQILSRRYSKIHKKLDANDEYDQSLYRTKNIVSKFAGITGSILNIIGLSILIEKLIPFFRILGRRSSWIKK